MLRIHKMVTQFITSFEGANTGFIDRKMTGTLCITKIFDQ